VHAFEVEPNTRCYNAAMTACAKAKQWQYPLKLLDVMQRRGVRLGHWLQDKSKRERERGSAEHTASELSYFFAASPCLCTVAFF
jgi:pentatricopeptide repeat protein